MSKQDLGKKTINPFPPYTREELESFDWQPTCDARPVSVQLTPLKTAKQRVATRRNRKLATRPQTDGKSS